MFYLVPIQNYSVVFKFCKYSTSQFLDTVLIIQHCVMLSYYDFCTGSGVLTLHSELLRNRTLQVNSTLHAMQDMKVTLRAPLGRLYLSVSVRGRLPVQFQENKCIVWFQSAWGIANWYARHYFVDIYTTMMIGITSLEKVIILQQWEFMPKPGACPSSFERTTRMAFTSF